MSADLKRQVKIKTGIVKRLRKELAMYEQEKVQNDKRVEDMRASGADTYDIRQAERVADESAMMIPDCKGRFDAAFSDLEKLVDAEKANDEIKDTEEYKLAVEALEA
uniref:Tubulin-specific chaperone A n=1 Tax=Phaeocystis cordata TaxID=118079 RepID=A0A7S1N056_9EUKA|mmetsp:Transcript_7068/g.17401  ORF Transcript_7068/g.17401 Transcript_7068/m.17401 type:complete len:107 (+) Transcript_7068:105-425(+)|eukprot:CAMPEP_0197486124 /NCGR_PEP_ID=MMETSP1311-20131121/1058_1 /TAXON_ID=464262 /ORGANISM="Genus nov. species nov., Strain RCC856" /LENGTH=106 /DNA_ID=CAMNT_0043029047 /DNA_START=34 /DNA_END=354 /DNA_ORIENTATION=+